MISRFEVDLGNDGFGEPSGLKAFGALYRFMDRTWSITIWARDWAEARRWCKRHGLKLDGLIIDRIDL